SSRAMRSGLYPEVRALATVRAVCSRQVNSPVGATVELDGSPQFALQDLAGRARRQRVAEFDEPRILERGHLFAGPGNQVVLGQSGAWAADDHGLYFLP